ncbi:hypothetical protein ACR779_06920 [Sphingobacterium lactis]
MFKRSTLKQVSPQVPLLSDQKMETDGFMKNGQKMMTISVIWTGNYQTNY